jgi:FixJ family two-component response regulator
VSRLVKGHGYKTVEHISAESYLLSSANSFDADALIVDVQLPGMKGPELLRYLRSHHRSVPVILITAYEDLDVVRDRSAHECVGVLRKPVDETELIGLIESVFLVGEEKLRVNDFSGPALAACA